MLGLDPLVTFFLVLGLLAMATIIVWFWPDGGAIRGDTGGAGDVPGWPLVTEERARELRAMSYRAYLQSPEWNQRSLAVRKQAGWKCVVCGGSNRLQAHHLTYERLGNERPGDLQVLCDDCHRQAHGGG